MEDEDHDTKRRALLLNLVVICMLVPASAYLCWFGISNLVRSEKQRRQKLQTSRNIQDVERMCFGWPYVKVLAATSLAMAFSYVACMWFYICVIPVWMRGYRKRSTANVICRVNFDMFLFFVGNSYVFFLTFWLERLNCTFQGALRQSQVSTRCKWMLRVPLFVVLFFGALYFTTGFLRDGTIVDLESTDINPFKDSNKHPTLCQPLQALYSYILASFGGGVVVFENAYLGYAYLSRLKAIFSRNESRMTDADSYMTKVAVVALVSVCSTLFCFIVELFVDQFTAPIAIDVVVNSLCVVSSFSFGNKHYQLFFAHFERLCIFSDTNVPPVICHTTMTSTSIAAAQNEVELAIQNATTQSDI